MTPRIGKIIGGFHHRVERQISGKHLQFQYNGTWEYPPLEETMPMVGREDMETYISRRHNKVAKYIAMQPILDLCLKVEQRPGSRVPKSWWVQ